MEPGLCAACRHARPICTAASTFWLCGLAQREPHRFPRYPRLPVRACAGFERAPDAA